jgi:hypothetical protein
MRSMIALIARLFGRGDAKDSEKKSQLVGMYMAETNKVNRTQYGGNRVRQHGKNYTTNRERA